MDIKTKAVLASMFGAIVGYGIGSTFLQGWWQLIAVMIGGIIGWVSFAPISLIKTGWDVTVSLSTYIRTIIKFFKAKENDKCIKHFLKRSVVLFSSVQLFGTSLFYFIVVIDYEKIGFNLDQIEHWIAIYLLILIAGLLYSICAFIINTTLWHDKFDELECSRYLGNSDIGVSSLKTSDELLYFNPITFPFTVIYGWYRIIKYIIPYLVNNTPRFFHFIFLVILETFRKANSSGRMTSLFGGATGTLVGLAFKNPILGMAIGGSIALLAILIGSQISEKGMKTFWKRYERIYSSS